MRRPIAEWIAFFEAVLTLAVARAAIMTLKFERAMRLGGLARSASLNADRDSLASVRWAVAAAARRVPWRALCLEQALAARMMLARRGAASSIHYGVARVAPRIEAHAWVYAGPDPVIGCENAGDFTELARFPPADARESEAGGTG